MKTIMRRSPLNYIFSVGRIRALERFLISSEVFSEAVEADLKQALRLFVESDLYSDELLHIKGSRDLEDVLTKETAKLKKLMQELILDEVLLKVVESDTLKSAEAVLKKYPSDFLQDYFLHLIDMYNIKTFLRLYILKEPKEVLSEFLVCEGFIKKDVFVEFYDKELAAFLHRLEYVYKKDRVIDYAYFLKEPIEKADKDKSFILLERTITDFLINVLRQAKYLSYGPEPVLAYYFAKVNEISLIRMIILAKLNDFSQVLVKERLNSVYA